MLPPMSPVDPIPLGPFDLLAPAGQGAMAEVWRARHRGSGTPAAVKIVTAPIGRQQTFRSWFAHELRAVARLDHPGVVRIYDHGALDEAVAAATDLPPGAPYLVMEWIDGGTLTRRAGRLPWHALRATLLGLLDALGHAHARGVIHRDLKPDNILLAERGPVLTDFGVAFTAERAADARDEAFAGTPNYMSPEQVTGDLHALGPWSDLYAVGCLTCTLVRGRPPFPGGDASRVARAQLLAPPPTLTPGLPVPVGFERWLHRLLAKRPAERFRFAADAAVALMALPDEAPLPFTQRRTGSLPDIDLGDADRTVVAPPVFLSTPAESWAVGPDLLGRPPVPAEWRRPVPPATPPPLLGVGRSLFGLRPPSVHGRVAERDALWAALRETARGDGARAVLISGPSGSGKSRLATWLSHRAHELGVADTLDAHHDAVGGPDTGLGPMLARAWRCEGLDDGRRRRQLRWVFGADADPALIEALSALLAPHDIWRSGDRYIASARERDAVLVDALARLAHRRPLVLRLDDAHWSSDTLGFVDSVLTARRELPLLFVCTVREAGLVEDGEVRAVLDRLAGLPPTRRLVLGPLPADALADQIRSQLPLAEPLVRWIVEWSGGNPHSAESLVERWIRHGALEEGPDGFRLRPGAGEALPVDARSIWRERLHDAYEAAHAPALEVAAMLGQTVDAREWRAVCARLDGVDCPPATVDALLDAGLIAGQAGTRWSFCHPMVRGVLLEDARRAGRFAAGHRACAEALAERAAPPARRAHHLMQAGAWAESLEPLRVAADQAIDRKQAATAHRAIIARLRALRRLRRPRGDRGWLTTTIRWAQLCRIRGDTRAAARHARHATVHAERLGDDRLLAEALLVRGRAVATRSGLERGLPLIVAAARRAAAAADAGLEGSTRLIEGSMRMASGDAAGADRAYQIALERFAGTGEVQKQASVHAAMADLARRTGDHRRARRHALDALDGYTAADSRWGRAHAANLLGDLDRFEGDLDRAEARYRESCRLYGGLGSNDAIAADGNLGLVLVETNRIAEARRHFERVIERADATHNRELGAIFRACLLPCLATDGDWKGWDATFAHLDPLRDGRLVEPDVARTVERAARFAAAAGQPKRAAYAWKLVIAQLEGLDRDPGPAREALDALVLLHGRPPR